MNRIRQIKELVYDELKENVDARNSDDILYASICLQMVSDESVLCKPWIFVMKNRKLFGLPKFESVRRARQKCQEEHPELSAVAPIRDRRLDCEREMREWARNG